MAGGCARSAAMNAKCHPAEDLDKCVADSKHSAKCPGESINGWCASLFLWRNQSGNGRSVFDRPCLSADLTDVTDLPDGVGAQGD